MSRARLRNCTENSADDRRPAVEVQLECVFARDGARAGEVEDNAPRVEDLICMGFVEGAQGCAAGFGGQCGGAERGEDLRSQRRNRARSQGGRGRTSMQAGPEIRTTAIADFPAAVESAKMVLGESW
jgi:hypothetical protein